MYQNCSGSKISQFVLEFVLVRPQLDTSSQEVTKLELINFVPESSTQYFWPMDSAGLRSPVGPLGLELLKSSQILFNLNTVLFGQELSDKINSKKVHH